jgi:hypothetical protein
MKTFLIVAISALYAMPAFVQDAGKDVQYKARTEIDFEGVDVQGELVKPAGQLLLDRRKANFNPLIQLREHFNEEMKRSVDQVK